MDPMRIMAFNQVWKRLEKIGVCDGKGGAEYKRVKTLYLQSDYGTNIETFIRFHANQVPVVEPLPNGSTGRGEKPQGGNDANER